MKELSIKIDFYKSIKYDSIYFVKADYNSCKIVFDIVQDIDNKRVLVSFKLSDGSLPIIIEATHLGANRAELILPTDVLSKEGKVYCQIALYDENSRLTNPIQFYYTVTKDLSDEAVSEIDDRVPILTELITEVQYILLNWRPVFSIVDGDLIMEVIE